MKRSLLELEFGSQNDVALRRICNKPMPHRSHETVQYASQSCKLNPHMYCHFDELEKFYSNITSLRERDEIIYSLPINSARPHHATSDKKKIYKTQNKRRKCTECTRIYCPTQGMPSSESTRKPLAERLYNRGATTTTTTASASPATHKVGRRDGADGSMENWDSAMVPHLQWPPSSSPRSRWLAGTAATSSYPPLPFPTWPFQLGSSSAFIASSDRLRPLLPPPLA